MLNGIRNIVMHRGPSVSRTVTLTIQSRDISSVSFLDANVYAKQPAVRQEAFDTTTRYAATCGIDAAGGESVEISGSYHSGGGNRDTFERLTGRVKDKNGNWMYFYRKSDGTFWDCVHIPRHTTANEHIWKRSNDYVPITKSQFERRQAPNV